MATYDLEKYIRVRILTNLRRANGKPVLTPTYSVQSLFSNNKTWLQSNSKIDADPTTILGAKATMGFDVDGQLFISKGDDGTGGTIVQKVVRYDVKGSFNCKLEIVKSGNYHRLRVKQSSLSGYSSTRTILNAAHDAPPLSTIGDDIAANLNDVISFKLAVRAGQSLLLP